VELLILVGICIFIALYTCSSLILVVILSVILVVILSVFILLYDTWDYIVSLLRVKHRAMCVVCGARLPRGSNDSICTFCSKGYELDHISPENIRPATVKDIDLFSHLI